jgi:outer membrane protein assembly factor BamB
MKHGLIVTGAFVIMAATAQADWPQYLGPDRNAVASDFKPARSWPDSGPRKLWSFPLGRGYGGASVHRGEVFVLDRIGDQSDMLRCIDLETGTEKWTYASISMAFANPEACGVYLLMAR